MNDATTNFDLYAIVKRMPLAAAYELASQQERVTAAPARRDSMFPTVRPQAR